METNASPKSTHLVHYFYSRGPGQMSHGTTVYTLPAGWTPANYEWVMDQLTQSLGVTPVITGVTAFDAPRPSIDVAGLAEHMKNMAGRLDRATTITGDVAVARAHVRTVAQELRVISEAVAK